MAARTARRRSGRLVQAALPQQHRPGCHRADFGIRLAAGPRFGVGGVFENHLRVAFTLPPEKLETAVLALRSAQERLDSSPQLRRKLKESPAVAVA